MAGVAAAGFVGKLKEGANARRLNERTDVFVEAFLDAIAGGGPDVRQAGLGGGGPRTASSAAAPAPPPEPKEAAAAAQEALQRQIEGGVGERPVATLAERLGILFREVEAAAAAADARAFAERVEAGLRSLLVAESVTLFLAAVGRQSFCAKHSAPEQASIMVPLGKGIVGSVAQAGGLAHPERVEGDPRYSPDFDDYAGGALGHFHRGKRRAHTMLCCAITVPASAAREGGADREGGVEGGQQGGSGKAEGGGSEGVLGNAVEAVVRVLNKRGGRNAAFSKADASLLSSACRLLGPLLARLLRLAAAHEATAAAWRTFDVASQCQLYPRSAFEALERFMGRRLRGVLQCDRLLLLLADTTERELVSRLYDVFGRRQTAGAAPPSLDLAGRIVGRVYSSGVEVAVHDAATDRRFSPKYESQYEGDNYLASEGSSVRTLLAVPIRIRSHVLGCYLGPPRPAPPRPYFVLPFFPARPALPSNSFFLSFFRLALAGAFCVQFLASRAHEAGPGGGAPHPVFARVLAACAQTVLAVEQEH
eukprot:tig00000133_g7717.t1